MNFWRTASAGPSYTMIVAPIVELRENRRPLFEGLTLRSTKDPLDRDRSSGLLGGVNTVLTHAAYGTLF